MRYKSPKNIEPIFKLDGEPLQKDDFRKLYVEDQLSLLTISYLFDAQPETIMRHMIIFKMTYRKEDAYIYAALVKEQEEERLEHQRKCDLELAARKESEVKRLREEAAKIIGKDRPAVEYTVVNGRKFADHGLIEAFERNIDNVVNQMTAKKTKIKEMNEVRNVDLSAMRLHRGLNMMQFSEKSGMPYKHVVYYEKTPNVIIPKSVSNMYFSVLNITKSEFKKIIECLSGTRKSMYEEDERQIPLGVREYVWKRDKGQCRDCGREEHIHFHHIERYSNGGKHEARNLKLLCVVCHAIEHYGEPGYELLKGMADKLGVTVDVSRKAEKERV